MSPAILGGQIGAVASLRSELGWLRVAATDSGICGVSLVTEPAGWASDTQPARELAASAVRQLDEYLQGARLAFDLPLDLDAGTAFQQTVWRATCLIPYGNIVAYGDIAQRIANPQAGRAVGQALKRNPLLVMVPCHRVVRMHGGLGGFRAGDAAKLWLLKHEGVLLL